MDQFKGYQKKLNAIIQDLSKKRDELRTLHGEVEQVLESFDQGIEDAGRASKELESAIDTMSQFV